MIMRYQKTNNGKVIVENGLSLYIDTPENFALDAGFSAPGAAGLVFVQGGLQCVIDSSGKQGAHGLSAAARSRIGETIAAAAELVAARQLRIEAAAAAAIDALPVDDKRRMEYAKRGATVDAMIVALWEYAIEGRTEAADQLQPIRAAVKTDLPK